MICEEDKNMTKAVINANKSDVIIRKQVERIYDLYCEGYGTRKMIERVDHAGYNAFTRMSY